MHLQDLRPTVAKAVEHGAQQTAISSFSWDVAGDCEDPRTVTMNGRHTRRPVSFGVSKAGKPFQYERARYNKVVSHDLSTAPMWLDMSTRCRRCEPCLAYRRRIWQARIMTEIMCSKRTWFGTLTLSPEEHYLSECRSPEDFSVLDEQQKFLELHRANGDLLTRYIKRVRKAAKGQLRILLVVEPHQSGLPHYHALIHEMHGSSITKKVLVDQWTHGLIRKWKLVDDPRKGAWYVAKYLTKTAGARVRASKQYGDIITALGPSNPDDNLGCVIFSPPPGEVSKEIPVPQERED